MGCECLKMKNSDLEIKTQNIEHSYIFHRNVIMRNTDTYITSQKTSDKNTDFNHTSKVEIKNSNNSNEINSKTTIEKNIPEIIKNINNNNSKQPVDDFSKYIFNHINKIRENPQSFINDIEEAKTFIIYKNSKKLIYKKNVKVALSDGIPAFQEAISILKICKPMNKLIFEPKLMVKLPENEDDIINKDYFKLEIKKMINKGIPIKSYWRDIINNPETSFLMMIVDDTGMKSGMKRNDILDPNMKYIGICSKNIGKNFICFLTFSDCKIN